MFSTVLMSRHAREAAELSPRPVVLWTLIGAAAIPLWALWPLFAVISSGGMPLFQFLSLINAVGAATLFALRVPARARQGADKALRAAPTRLLPAVMVAVGIMLSNILFLLAIRRMPAAEANLIVYLWPLMIALLAAPLGLMRLRIHHLVSIALGLCGAALIIGPGSIEAPWSGVALAAGSGLAWAVFCVFRLRQGPDAPDTLTGGLALSAALAVLLHLGLETTVTPSPAALLSAILNGVVPLAIGNLAWDHGLRRGNRQLLTVFAYATPLVAALILIAFGYAQASSGLLLGGALIVAGSIVSARR